MDFCGNYKNKSQFSDEATKTEQKLKTLSYRGDVTIFNIENIIRVLWRSLLI